MEASKSTYMVQYCFASRASLRMNDLFLMCIPYFHEMFSLFFSCFTEEHQGFDWQQRYTIIKGLCMGLKYLHMELESPIQHLDLKPENILLDNNMLPKIADFGLSRLLGEENTKKTISPLGTL